MTPVTSTRTPAEHYTFKGNQTSGRHSWLRLTPAYSWRFVQSLVESLPRESVVLDPFCGTGTTALVCAQRGVVCDTVDINPFLVWLAQAKCARYSDASISQAEQFAIQLQHTGLPKLSSWLPKIRDIHKWWPAPILGFLSALRDQIQSVSDDGARDLLNVAFCRLAIEHAAVSFGHQSMSFKKQVAIQLGLLEHSPAEQTLLRFKQLVRAILASAREELLSSPRVLLGDSRALDQLLPAARYTAVITSPPYPNRMSYIRELRPYMYWLGYLDDGRQAGELDWQAIGGTWGRATSQLQRWLPDASIVVPWTGFTDLITNVSKRSLLLARYVHKYFEDIYRHLCSLIPALQPGAKVWYVVGNSKFYDVLVPTEAIFAALFEALGLMRVTVTPLRKRTSKRELFEYLVYAEKP